MIVYLSLGSNEGDRAANLRKAVEALEGLPTTTVEKVSDVIQTRAEGFEGNDFLNCCVRISTGLPPMRLLERVKEIERAMGRVQEGEMFAADGSRIYTDRPIDIDILLYGRRKINDEKLTVPHPRMYEREFVMIPLKQINSKI